MIRVLATVFSFAFLANQATAAIPMFLKSFDIMKGLEALEGKTGMRSVNEIVPDQYFEQAIVDHNTPESQQKFWKQRYHVYDGYYGGEGSPVFMYINGENAADPNIPSSTGLFVNVLAKKHKALVVSVEHRFYGKSFPTVDSSNENLKYLSAEQALSDLATFHQFFTKDRKLKDSKWIAFGGSYPGMLAAWTKLKYPELFAGSVASSGPINAKIDFHEYMDITGEGLRYYGGDKCVANVKAAIDDFNDLVSGKVADNDGIINKLFAPCTPMTTDLDRSVFESNIMGNFQNAAQGNDYVKWNLKAICDHFAKDGKPIERLAFLNNQTSFSADSNCTPSNYKNGLVQSLNNFNNSEINSYRQWMYQTCAEFGYALTASTGTSPFAGLQYVNVNVYTEMCKDAFNITDTKNRIAATNKKYGALKIDVPNVVFPSGTIDPWSALALSNSTGTVNPRSEVIYIEGTSHCRDMLAPSANDLPQIIFAHEKIANAVARFLSS